MEITSGWTLCIRSHMHAFLDYHDFITSANASSCSYNPEPGEPGGVINASAYRAFLLTRAGLDFSQEQYLKAAERNLELCP